MCSGKKSLKWLAVKPFQHLAKVFLFGPSNKKSEDPPLQPMILNSIVRPSSQNVPFPVAFHEGGSVSNWKKRKEKYPKGPESRKARMQSREARILQGLAGTFRLFCALASLWLESEIIMLIRLVCIWFVV